MLSNYPDYWLIEKANEVQSFEEGFSSSFTRDCDKELETRQPPPREPEYDQDGNQIVSEFIGYSDEGDEVWTTNNFLEKN